MNTAVSVACALPGSALAGPAYRQSTTIWCRERAQYAAGLRIFIMTLGNTNAHAVAVRPASYGYGTILSSAEAEARKSTQGRHMIRERVRTMGKDSIYNLTGLVRTFPLQPEDLAPPDKLFT